MCPWKVNKSSTLQMPLWWFIGLLLFHLWILECWPNSIHYIITMIKLISINCTCTAVAKKYNSHWRWSSNADVALWPLGDRLSCGCHNTAYQYCSILTISIFKYTKCLLIKLCFLWTLLVMLLALVVDCFMASPHIADVMAANSTARPMPVAIATLLSVKNWNPLAIWTWLLIS